MKLLWQVEGTAVGGKETESMTFLATVEISLPLEMWV